MPSNSLKLGIWRYSEILLHPILNEEEITIQRGAIKEEKRLMDNRPYSRFLPYIQKHLFKKHPYKEPIIGSIEHLDAAVYEDFINFNAKFYTTRNAVFTVAGDIDIDDDGGGKLYKKLVDEQKIALEVQAVSLPLEEYGIYAILALPLGDTPLDQLKTEIDEEIVALKSDLISEKDYQKLQNIYENNFVNSNASIQGVATSLSQNYLFYNDTNLINSSIEIYKSITREEIRDVASKYLNDNQRVVMDYLPENK